VTWTTSTVVELTRCTRPARRTRSSRRLRSKQRHAPRPIVQVRCARRHAPRGMRPGIQAVPESSDGEPMTGVTDEDAGTVQEDSAQATPAPALSARSRGIDAGDSRIPASARRGRTTGARVCSVPR